MGIDAERMAALPDLASLARASLTPAEARELEVPGADGTASFYRCWVRKEALLKAQGLGLSSGPDAAEVLLSPDGRPRCSSFASWTIDAWSPAPGAVAALAAEGPWARVDRGTWTEAMAAR